MKQIRFLLQKLFCLPIFLTVIIAVPAFVFVAFVLIFYESQNHTILPYAAYLLSAYALIISITAAVRVIRKIKADGRRKFNSAKITQKIRSNPLGEKLLENATFRAVLGMHGSLAINLIYAITNGYSGIRHASAWSVSLAMYYLLLVIMRGTLIGYTHRTHAKRNLAAEYRRYRMIGILLLFMNQALTAMVVYMTYQNKGTVYSGLMIYWMATYTFYITISAIVHTIRYRKKNDPVLSAAKIISLTASLVSMLSLETAMLTQFHDETKDPIFRRWMVGLSGGAVCVLVLGIAVFMIVKSTKYLRRHRTTLPEYKYTS